jgi:hypothetical protein
MDGACFGLEQKRKEQRATAKRRKERDHTSPMPSDFVIFGSVNCADTEECHENLFLTGPLLYGHGKLTQTCTATGYSTVNDSLLELFATTCTHAHMCMRYACTCACGCARVHVCRVANNGRVR